MTACPGASFVTIVIYASLQSLEALYLKSQLSGHLRYARELTIPTIALCTEVDNHRCDTDSIDRRSSHLPIIYGMVDPSRSESGQPHLPLPADALLADGLCVIRVRRPESKVEDSRFGRY